MPLEQQYRSWNQIVQPPYDKRDVDAYTRVRGILMNGIENEVWVYSHQFARSAGSQRSGRYSPKRGASSSNSRRRLTG